MRVEVTLQNNRVIVEEVDESFDLAEINRKRNDNDTLAILIGKGDYSRIDLKLVRILEDEEEPFPSGDQISVYKMSLEAQEEQARIWAEARK